MKRLSVLLLIMVILICGCSQNKNDAIQNKIYDRNDTLNYDKDKKNVENSVVLYCGIPLDDKDKNINIENCTEEQKKLLFTKYERQYFLYSNGNLSGKGIGKIEERGLDYNWQVSFADEKYNSAVAISAEFNPYPRQAIVTNSDFQNEFINKVITEVNNKFVVNSKILNLITIDLDGDNQNEYLGLFYDEKECFFSKVLLNFKFNIISYLTVFKENCDNFNSVLKDYNFQNSGEIIDYNNDGIMEIFINLPSYEGFVFKIFKYKNGEFDGDFITNASFKP